MNQPLLDVQSLSVTYGGRGRRSTSMHALADVSFSVERGKTLAVVGESGSGKSTAARAILRLVEARGGRVLLNGTDILSLDRRELRRRRRDMQIVLQDPYSSLDPSSTVGDSVAEPLRVHRRDLDAAGRRELVASAFERVGLSTHHLGRYPYEFSGGQRQRIAIARAIVIEPELVILDEAVSALDVSTQSQVLNLLRDLQTDMGMTYLFITHDLSVVRNLADDVVVLRSGEIVERGETATVYRDPQHPYTRTLLDAVPLPDPQAQRRRRAQRRRAARGDAGDGQDASPVALSA
ncbi:dipeptide ABC transporter ATP-binding protein [Acrocarpospora macrocephala]|uniref:Peptide ABC transporter ATP-binding protein n=1 Tax=Acrocarpospora macrocephala TaxID=150177 RepID=A0A5M3WJH8_9ACTN|nr:ATP-binding cassette domain-containing protein [Acrocarpospora macrocephala]GES09365.1 peptide ABC transporter ATP-binding protein [Acrocarpospora macrocephala]